MAHEDRLKRDYDIVENLSDLIEAREERESAFVDDVDSLDDINLDNLPFDPEEELSYPHHHGPSEEERLGLDVELMDTPDESQIEFDWQDSAEEMLPTDPPADEGMEEPDIIKRLSQVDPLELIGPIPSTDVSPEADTAATEEEAEEYETDCNEDEKKWSLPFPIPLESAMETDSDEVDFSIGDRFAGEIDHETAHAEFEEMRILMEKEHEKEEAEE
ncbi:MAG: hypothetical protein K6T99_08325 [Armatimonadetes bacterium]|nr:hypothetical protein [Armatimonadota bacterium]